MANYWLVKTEPSTYSYDDLERATTAVWDGVKNPVALRNLRSMHPGDQVFVYHTGDEKAVVGLATVVSAPYADPKKNDPKLFAIDLKASRRLSRAVMPATIAARPAAFITFPVRRNAALMRCCRCSDLTRFCASFSNRSASRAAVSAHFRAVLAALTAAVLKRSVREAIGILLGLNLRVFKPRCRQ